MLIGLKCKGSYFKTTESSHVLGKKSQFTSSSSKFNHFFLKWGIMKREMKSLEDKNNHCMNSSNELCYVKRLFRNEIITGVFTECRLLRCQLTHKNRSSFVRLLMQLAELFA